MRVRTHSSTSTPGGASSTSNRATPRSDGDVVNGSTTDPVGDLNLNNLRLNSSTPSTSSGLYSASTNPAPRLTPETELPEASSQASDSSPTPSILVLTPGTSTAPSAIGTEQPTSSNSSSFGTLSPDVTIDFAVSISNASRSPFQFPGSDYPLPSVEGSSTPPRQASAPTRQSSTPTDRAGSMTSQLRQMQISDDSRASTEGNPTGARPQPTTQTPPRFLTPRRDGNDSTGRRDGSSLSPAPRPSTGRRRRSSSQMNQAPHSLSDEEPPEDDFNDPAFQRSFSKTRKLMASLEETLGSSDIHLEPDSTITRFRKTARKLAQFHCPPTRTVGFVGDSGVGKSSLLNSLLDRKGLARASNSGAACTCVVTEYHYHSQPNFQITVDFFTMEELETQLTKMVRAYRRLHRGPAATRDRDEQEDIADRAKLASDTFQAMFRGREEFDNGRYVLGDEPEEDMVAEMLSWVVDILEDSELYENSEDGLTFDSQEECSKALADLTSDRRHNSQEPNAARDTEENEHSLWPFIKKIIVYVDAHILSKGLILVDLPGLRDLNSARQNITERYILECDEVFAVCWIGRAGTDVGVKAVFDLARQARLSNVGIVCTKSDVNEPHEALTDWTGPEGRELEERMDRLKAAEDELEAMKARKTELMEIQQDDELLEEERRELEDLSFRIHSTERTIETLKFEQARYLVTTRNRMVKTELESLYRGTIPGGHLEVFCVSNKLYWKHRQFPRDKALPWLQLSGIIALRKHCVAMVSDSQLRTATNYMNNDVRSLISSVELWVQSGAGTETAERKALVRETLDVIEDRLKKDLSGRQAPFAKIVRTLAEQFHEQIYSRSKLRNWTRGAVEASGDWAGWHPSSYSAFCRNYGRHCTGVIGARNWNEEAMDQMVRDVGRYWKTFQDSITNQAGPEATDAIIEVMGWAIEYLDEELGEEDASAEILHGALESRQGLFVDDVENAYRVFKSGLRTLQSDVLSSHRTSFMGEGMESAYNKCQAESGTGSDARRKNIIFCTVSDETLFETIMDKFQDRFRELATQLQNSIKNAVKKHLAAIGQTMDILRDVNVIAEAERDKEFRERVEQEVGRIRDELPGRLG